MVIPEQFFQGILMKIIFVIGLSYGLSSVLKSNKLAGESPYLLENDPRQKSRSKKDSNILDDEI